jgi:hypothetical protein
LAYCLIVLFCIFKKVRGEGEALGRRGGEDGVVVVVVVEVVKMGGGRTKGVE